MSTHENSKTIYSSNMTVRNDRCFAAYMNVYNGETFYTKEHEGWVHDMLRKYPELCETTLIYHNEDSQPGYTKKDGTRVYGVDDKIVDNLMYPIPIYWGKPRDDLFNWTAVKKGFGYTEVQTTKLPEELRHTVRYAIVGKVKVKAYGNLPERDSHVIHTEGVNLESQTTPAFKAIILGKRPDEIIQEYFNRHRAMLKLIVEAAMSQTENHEHAFIQAPMIGAGCFLRGLKGTGIDTTELLQQQVFAMESVLNMAPPEYNFTYKLCIFNTDDFDSNIVSAYQNLAYHNSRFIIGMNHDGGNVMKDVPFGNPNQKVFVVNAGDLRSFIGNGMKRDNSVEGFIVANARGFNPQWQNTSFLHNPYFNPDIFYPVKSISTGRQVWKETMSW